MPVFETRDLAIYGSIIATLNGGWTLYHGVIRDRARVVLRIAEGVEMYEGEARVLMIGVKNRGRRALNVALISRVMDVRLGTRLWMAELDDAAKRHPMIAADQGHTYLLGPLGYERGKFPKTRWFIEDGAGRVYPLRERCRQRAEALVFWPLRRLDERREAGRHDD